MANPENLASPWQPGQSGNPGGKTSEQKRREMRNAEMATQLRERMLESLVSKLADVNWTPELEASMLKLIKDSEDRGLGQPQQTVEHRGNVSPVPVPTEAEWAEKHAAGDAE